MSNPKPKCPICEQDILDDDHKCPPKCPICLDYINSNLEETKCKHVFHRACIQKSLVLYPDCPVCKALIDIEASGKRKAIRTEDDLKVALEYALDSSQEEELEDPEFPMPCVVCSFQYQFQDLTRCNDCNSLYCTQCFNQHNQPNAFPRVVY